MTETDRVKHALTMERPMPTVIAALEYLLDVTSEHLGNIHDAFFADRATPPTQFAEIVGNHLFLSAGSYHRPDLTPDETPATSTSTAESIRELSSAQTLNKEPSIIHPLRHIEVSLLQTAYQHHLQLQLRALAELDLPDGVLPRWKPLIRMIQQEKIPCVEVHASDMCETNNTKL